MLEEADACAVVPMVGMVESLNVSVAAALMLHEARRGRVAALVRALAACTGCESCWPCPYRDMSGSIAGPADVMRLWR